MNISAARLEILRWVLLAEKVMTIWSEMTALGFEHAGLSLAVALYSIIHTPGDERKVLTVGGLNRRDHSWIRSAWKAWKEWKS